MTTLKRFTLIVSIIILTACSVTPKTPLETNREKWDSQRIGHYSFKLAVGCFCAFRNQMPLAIEIKDGKVVSMLDSAGQPVPQFAEIFDTYNTVEKLFGKLSEKADKITVEYNKEYGYPESIYIDYMANAADDEISFTITDFVVLK